jgi:hypothetical protein
MANKPNTPTELDMMLMRGGWPKNDLPANTYWGGAPSRISIDLAATAASMINKLQHFARSCTIGRA